MSGNPVRFGDGCATVTGYKLPTPLARCERLGRRERGQARSQDIGLAVLVRPFRALVVPSGRFSAKEKDEASPLNRFQGNVLNAFIRPFAESEGVFVFRLRAGLSTRTRSRFGVAELKDQLHV